MLNRYYEDIIPICIIESIKMEYIPKITYNVIKIGMYS